MAEQTPGEYVGADGRTHRVGGWIVLVGTIVGECDDVMPHDPDWPAAKVALDALVEEQQTKRVDIPLDACWSPRRLILKNGVPVAVEVLEHGEEWEDVTHDLISAGIMGGWRLCERHYGFPNEEDEQHALQEARQLLATLHCDHVRALCNSCPAVEACHEEDGFRWLGGAEYGAELAEKEGGDDGRAIP